MAVQKAPKTKRPFRQPKAIKSSHSSCKATQDRNERSFALTGSYAGKTKELDQDGQSLMQVEEIGKNMQQG